VDPFLANARSGSYGLLHACELAMHGGKDSPSPAHSHPCMRLRGGFALACRGGYLPLRVITGVSIAIKTPISLLLGGTSWCVVTGAMSALKTSSIYIDPDSAFGHTCAFISLENLRLISTIWKKEDAAYCMA